MKFSYSPCDYLRRVGIQGPVCRVNEDFRGNLFHDTSGVHRGETCLPSLLGLDCRLDMRGWETSPLRPSPTSILTPSVSPTRPYRATRSLRLDPTRGFPSTKFKSIQVSKRHSGPIKSPSDVKNDFMTPDLWRSLSDPTGTWRLGRVSLSTRRPDWEEDFFSPRSGDRSQGGV